MNTFTIKAGEKTITVKMILDTVNDYNAENGFTEDDIEFDENWVCALVDVSIGNETTSGEVQWDDQNNEYSTNCDGNMFKENIQYALLANFDDEVLYDDIGLPTDFRIMLTEEVLPKIDEKVCEFGKQEIKEFKAI